MNRHERRQAVAAGRKRVIRGPSATPPSPTMSVGSRSEPVTGGLAASAIAAETFPARILYPVCPLCGSGDLALVHEADCTAHPLYKPPLPNAMRWKSCTACEHVFTEGFFTAEALDVVFSDTHKNQQVGSDFERQRPVSARMIRQVTPYVTSGDWLDVGFGNGSLVFTADEFGFNAVGVDLRSTNVEGLRRLGFEAYCSDVADLDMTGRFSVISMADVLEHIPYPNKALAAAYRLLRPGGVLFLSMPNAGAFAWRAMDALKANPFWAELEHYHNFSRKRLYALLESHAFTLASYGVSERYRLCMEVVATRA